MREARSSLEEMREQHREKVRQQELEQDMLRRMQIEQKLELMRQQKAEYLAYQQRLQTERQAVIEQQQQQQQRLQYQRQMQQQQQIPFGGIQYQGLSVDCPPYLVLFKMADKISMSQRALPEVMSQRYLKSAIYPSQCNVEKTTEMDCILWPVPAFGWAPVKMVMYIVVQLLAR